LKAKLDERDDYVAAFKELLRLDVPDVKRGGLILDGPLHFLSASMSAGVRPPVEGEFELGTVRPNALSQSRRLKAS
jgi:hypothetical protein